MCSLLGDPYVKYSTIGISFNGAENNCIIAHILSILLMNICDIKNDICSNKNLSSVPSELNNNKFFTDDVDIL